MDPNQVQQIVSLLQSAADQSPHNAAIRTQALQALESAFTVPACGPILFVRVSILFSCYM